MVHVVPPRGNGLVMFIDESGTGDGIDLAWCARGRLRRIPLGLEAVPASAVSNICFSPDGHSIALLVTLAHGTLTSPDHDPLRRLRGWGIIRKEGERNFNIQYDPCEDCTVQVVDLCEDEEGYPTKLMIHTFSHVFVPEYGFDMVWRRSGSTMRHQELAFAAMLHSEAGAATYLVRWKTFRDASTSNFIFMACIEGASLEFLQDKRNAMMTQPSTVCTSRIEIANDAKHIFFDTVSKFGILRFDQVDDATAAKVTRADLQNQSMTRLWNYLHSTGCRMADCETIHLQSHQERRESVIEINSTAADSQDRSLHSRASDYIRISRMSPDGNLLCSIVFTRIHSNRADFDAIPASKHIEMRSSLTGRLIYRRVLIRSCDHPSQGRKIRVRLEKSTDIAQHTLAFSDDSSLLVVWDTQVTNSHCIIVQRLPAILDAETGSLIQDFGTISAGSSYESVQASPNAQTVYGTRMENSVIKMDAIDVSTGSVIKTVTLTGAVHQPKHFSAHSIYLVPPRRVHAVSRGNLDILCETTRGSVGCGWTSCPQFEGPDKC